MTSDDECIFFNNHGSSVTKNILLNEQGLQTAYIIIWLDGVLTVSIIESNICKWTET